MKRNSTLCAFEGTVKKWHGNIAPSFLKIPLILFILTLSIQSLNAQSTGCPNCTADDIKIAGVSLVYNGPSCPDSTTIITDAHINVDLTVTATTRYGFYVYYELWIDGKPATPFYNKQCFPQTFSKLGGAQVQLVSLPPFMAYQQVEIRNVMTAWSQNAPVNNVYFCENLDGYACDQTTPKCKFYNFGFPSKIFTKPVIWGITNNQPVCSGSTATFRIGGTPNATVDYLLDGVSGTVTLDTNGYANVSKANATSSVTLEVTSINSSGCITAISNQTSVANVNTLSNPGSVAGGELICAGGDPAALSSASPAVGTGIVVYQWQSKTGSGSWTDISGATAESYDPPAGINATTYFRRMAIAVGCSSQPSNELTVTVMPTNAGTITGDQVVCVGTVPGSFTSATDASGATSVIYLWQKSTDGTNWTDITGATGNSYTETNSLTVNTSYRRKAILTSDLINCTVFSNSVGITINQINAAGSINGNQIICASGDATTLTSGTTTVNAVGDITYQWQYSTNNGNTWTNVTGATADSYDPPAGSVTTKTIFRRGTAVIVNGSTCDNTFTNNITIDITSLSSAGTISSNQSICVNATPSTLTSSNNATVSGGTASYGWQSSTDGTNWTTIANATSSTYAPGTLAVKTWYRRQANALNNSTVCESDFTSPIAITVNQVDNAGSISADQVICKTGTPAPLSSTTTATVTGTSSIAYRWQSSTDGGINWTNISGATSANYAPSTLSTTTSYRRTASVTANSVVCNTLNSNNVIITVNGVTSPGSIDGNQTICTGADATILATGTTLVQAVGDLTYQWQSSKNNGNTWVNIAGATAESYDPPAGSITDKTLFRRNTGVLLNGAACDNQLTNIVTVRATKLNSPGSIATSQIICVNTAPSTLTSSNNASVSDGTLNYKWQVSTDGVNWNYIDGATSSSYSSGALTQNTFFRREAIALNVSEVCQNDFTSFVTMSVNQVTDGGAISASQEICNNQIPTTFTSTTGAAAIGTVTYQWQSSTDNGTTWTNITDATASAYSASRLKNTTYYRRVASVKANGITCNTLNSNDIIVTVDKVLNAGSITSDQTICPLGDPALITQGSNAVDAVGEILYQWQISTNDGNTWSNISGATLDSYDPLAGTISSNTLFRRGAYVVADTRTCDTRYSNPVNVFATTLDTVGAVSSDQIICSGSAPLTLTSLSDAVINQGTASYNWQMSVDGVNWTNISGAIDPAYAPGTMTKTTLYRRMISALNGTEICKTDFSNALTIAVNNVDNGGSISSDQLICKTDKPADFGSTSSASGTGSLIYQWEYSADGGTTWTAIDTAKAETYSSPVLDKTTMFRRLASVSANDVACNTQNSNVVTVTLGSVTDAGTISGTETICLGSNPRAFLTTDAKTNTSSNLYYQWQKSIDGGTTWLDIATGTNAGYDESRPVWLETQYRRVALFNLANGSTCESLSSNIISLSVKECEKCTLLNEYTRGYPNPFKHNFTLKFTSCVSGTALIELFDFKGGKLSEYTIPNVIAGVEVKYDMYQPQSLTGLIYKISIGEYSTVGRMISAQ